MSQASVICMSVTLLLVHNQVSGSAPDDYLDLGVDHFNTACDDWDFARFAQAADIFETVSVSHPNSGAAHYWLGVARFHMLLHRLGDKKHPAGSAETKRMIKEAVTPLEQAVKLDEKDAESHALLSVLTGIEIARKPIFGPMLGPRYLRHKEAAVDNGPENPRVHYLIGTSYFHGPDALGGKKKALEAFLKAERLFAKESRDTRGRTQPLWGYSSCLTFTGKTYARMGLMTEAKEYFDKALSVNPNDGMALECAGRLDTESTGGG